VRHLHRAKDPKRRYLRRSLIHLGQRCKRIFQFKHAGNVVELAWLVGFQVHPATPTPTLCGGASPRVIDKHIPKNNRCGRSEMLFRRKFAGIALREFEECFMHNSRWLKSVPRGLSTHVHGRQLVESIVDPLKQTRQTRNFRLAHRTPLGKTLFASTSSGQPLHANLVAQPTRLEQAQDDAPLEAGWDASKATKSREGLMRRQMRSRPVKTEATTNSMLQSSRHHPPYCATYRNDAANLTQGKRPLIEFLRIFAILQFLHNTLCAKDFRDATANLRFG
jgi:hypothetical protein